MRRTNTTLTPTLSETEKNVIYKRLRTGYMNIRKREDLLAPDVLQLVQAGTPYSEIEAQTGIPRATAQRWVSRLIPDGTKPKPPKPEVTKHWCRTGLRLIEGDSFQQVSVQPARGKRKPKLLIPIPLPTLSAAIEGQDGTCYQPDPESARYRVQGGQLFIEVDAEPANDDREGSGPPKPEPKPQPEPERKKQEKLPRLMHSYFGSKYLSGRNILVERAKELIGDRHIEEYREAFLGGGGATAVFLTDVFPHVPNVVLNDLDPWIAHLWQTMLSNPEGLQAVIPTLAPTPEELLRIQHMMETTAPTPGDVRQAAEKIACHRWSYRALGIRGGLRGDAVNRWNPPAHQEAVREWNRILTRRGRRTEITCQSFEAVIQGAGPNTFLYGDPPYVVAGKDAYALPLKEEQHTHQATLLRECEAPWLWSYDDHPMIWDLYASWADVRRTDPVPYRVGPGPRKPTRELVITPRRSGALKRAA